MDQVAVGAAWERAVICTLSVKLKRCKNSAAMDRGKAELPHQQIRKTLPLSPGEFQGMQVHAQSDNAADTRDTVRPDEIAKPIHAEAEAPC